MAIAASVLSNAKTGGRGDWRTPDVVLERVRRMDCGIGIDPCASSNPDHWIAKFVNITAEQDGLTSDWNLPGCEGVAFVNWPYSRSAEWIDCILRWADTGYPIVGLGACRPGARWYRKAKAHADAVAEWRGRIKFVGAQHPAPFPSALFAYNLSWRRFAAALDGVADVEVPR